MSSKLPDHIKSLVIQQWLQGVQRDLIAANNGVSAGAVTNVVNEWRRGLGSAIIDDLRELGVTFRKVGITPAQCALGFRIAMMISKLGVKKDDLEPFILHVYNNCIDLGVSPDNVASHIKDLLEFSKNTNNNAVPLSQISDFIQQKTNEKKKLEQEIQTLKDEIKTLNEEKLDSEHRRASALQNENMTAVELKSYSDLKEDLGQYGIPIHDVSKFAKAVLGISQKGYDVGKVIEEFSELESTRSNYWDYKDSIPDLKIKYDGLNQEYSKLEQSVNSCKQKLSLNNELQAMGFGIKELKLLRNTIKEIADANNNIPPDQAQQKFYKDIEEQSDDKLGFESQLNKLRSEIATVSNNLTFLRTATLAQPLVGPSLQRLFSKGLSEQDIVELANIFERSHSDSSNDIDDDKNSRSSSTGIDKQSLTGLQKYGSDKLRNQIDELQTNKKDLEEQNQSMLSILAYSKPVVQFFNRTDDDHSLGNDYNNVKILAAIAIILYILYIRYEGVGKLVTGEHKEIMPLSMAVASGGNVQAISIPQLKTAIAKALEILIAKLDTKPQTKEDLVVQGSTSSINNQQYNSKNV